MPRVSQEPVGRPRSLRLAYGALALVAILGVGLVGGVAGQKVATEGRSWSWLSGRPSSSSRSTAQQAACNIERRSLITVEEAYKADHQEFGGIYASEATLVAEGWLEEESTYYDIVLHDPPTSYGLIAVVERPCS